MEIIIERGKVIPFEDLPPFSVALDGFVQGPQLDTENHRYSFDHHGGCIRFATSAACIQTRDAIALGLKPESYTIFCNDVDSDVCASIWCLKNPDRCKEPNVIKLIDAIGKGDMHGGAIDVNGMRKIVDWISAPHTDSIRNGDYEKLSDEGLNPILESVLHRIDTYADGEHSIEVSKQEEHGEFKVLRNENGWALIESTDPYVLSAVWMAGFDRVVIMRSLENATIAVTLAKRSDFIDSFPLEKFYSAFNKKEKGWGGGSSIGGCVRNPDGTRSKLTMETIIETIDGVIAGKPKKKTSSKTKS